MAISRVHRQWNGDSLQDAYSVRSDPSDGMWLMRGGERVLPLSDVSGERIADLLTRFRRGLLENSDINCHGVTQYVLGKPGEPCWINEDAPRGDSLTVRDAIRTLELPCAVQLIDARAGGCVALVHSAVVLGQTSNEDPLVFHKPGDQAPEFCALDESMRWFDTEFPSLSFFGAKRTR